MLPRNFKRTLNYALIMPIGVSLSDNRCKFLYSWLPSSSELWPRFTPFSHFSVSSNNNKFIIHDSYRPIIFICINISYISVFLPISYISIHILSFFYVSSSLLVFYIFLMFLYVYHHFFYVSSSLLAFYIFLLLS